VRDGFLYHPFFSTACRPSREVRIHALIRVLPESKEAKARKGSSFLSDDKEKGLLLCGETEIKSYSLYIYCIPCFPSVSLSVTYQFYPFSCATPSFSKGEGKSNGIMMVLVPLLVVNKQRLTTCSKYLLALSLFSHTTKYM
jgi:hypothetical protein